MRELQYFELSLVSGGKIPADDLPEAPPGWMPNWQGGDSPVPGEESAPPDTIL